MIRNKSKKTNHGFVSLIGLLITIVIICILYYLSITAASKESGSETQAAKSNPRSVLDNARNTVSDINKRQSDSIDQ